MSGGHFEYFQYKMQDVAEQICPRETTKEEKICGKLMKDFADVIHELDWWLSGDTGQEQFLAEFNKFQKKWLKVKK